MLEFWKRAESTVALKWGMSNFEKTETERPEFRGDEIDSYINGRKMLYFHPSIESRRGALSNSVVATFILLVLGIVTGIYTLRFSLQPSIGSLASVIASILNTVQIQLVNLIYQYVAVGLTNNENHRTDTEYEDAMISKLFIFQVRHIILLVGIICNTLRHSGSGWLSFYCAHPLSASVVACLLLPLVHSLLHT